MKLFAMLACLCLCVSACTTNDDDAVKTLDDNGFSDIQIVDRGLMGTWKGCSDKDGTWYSANATNAKGKRVNMLVCCGGNLSLKACTVRSR